MTRSDKQGAKRWWGRWLERPIPIHPFIVSLPMLLTYTQYNIDMTTWGNMLPTYAVTVVLTMLLWGCLLRVAHNHRTAATITSLLVLGIWVHGDVLPWVRPLWLVICVASLVLMRWHRDGAAMTTFANTLAILSVVPNCWQVLVNMQADVQPKVAPGYLDALPIRGRATGELPDVWFIVLDGYGREDVLRELYGYNNWLVPFLREKGFFVAERGTANYCQTGLAFSSSLNIDYLPELLTDRAPSAVNRRALTELIGTNRVVHAFRRAGYRIVEYPSEYSTTRQTEAVETRKPWLTFTEFEYPLLGKTPVSSITRALRWPQSRLAHAIRRRHINWVFADLARGDRWEQPTFVFAHVMAPHPPFIFTPDGDYRPTRSFAIFADGSQWWRRARLYGERYEPAYRDQLEYVNRRTAAVVEGILASSRRPPIILIQGDHGPGGRLDWESKEKSDIRERLAILLAVYLPTRSGPPLSDSITPVNVWRTILNQALGASLPLLPDRSYFSTWSRPYDFIDVTEELRRPPTAGEPAEQGGVGTMSGN